MLARIRSEIVLCAIQGIPELARKLSRFVEKVNMSLLRKRRPNSKRNPNPYASRGLDKFALVVAELAEERQKLSQALGTPAPVLMFTAGSQRKWFPVIVSLAKKKAIETKSSSPMISKRNVSTLQDSAATPPSLNPAAMQPQSAMTRSDPGKSAVTNGKDRSLCTVGSGSEAWPENTARMASMFGTLSGMAWAAKFSTTVRMIIATTLVSSAPFRRLNANTIMAMERSLSETPADEEASLIESSARDSGDKISSSDSSTRITTDASTAHPLSMASPSSPNIESHLPVPPPVRISKALPKKTSPRSSDAATLVSSPTTPYSRFKSKFLRDGLHKKQETLSTPSTPRVRTAHIAATRSDTAFAHIVKSPQKRELVNWRSLARERHRKDKAARIERSLAAIGLVIGLGGMFLGQITALLGMVCWWYMLPSIRKAVGDRPCARTDSHNSIDKLHPPSTPIAGTTISSKKIITGAGDDKYDMQSDVYKKKVIMDGLLERDRNRPKACLC